MRLINFISFIFFLLAAAIFGMVSMDKFYKAKCNQAFDNKSSGYRFVMFHVHCIIEADDITVIYPIEYGEIWKAKRDRRLERAVK